MVAAVRKTRFVVGLERLAAAGNVPGAVVELRLEQIAQAALVGWIAGREAARSRDAMRSSALPAADPEPVLSKMHHASTDRDWIALASRSISAAEYGEK